MTSYWSLSQNTKTKIGLDSTMISNKALISMAKESKKCDSLKVAFNSINNLVNSLADNSIKTFSEFLKEREKKEKAQAEAEEIRKELLSLDRKRFGIGISTGVGVNSDFKFYPAILVGINFSIIRF